jgi:hypothetical protein
MKSHVGLILFVCVQTVSCEQSAVVYNEDMQLRYDLLDSFAGQYKRPFTSVEVAAGKGDYSLHLAELYMRAVCVMIEGNEPKGTAWADLIMARCNKQKESNIILLGSLARTADIQRLGECEHFDLVFSFCGIERAGTLWKELIDAMATLGDHLLLEVLDNHKQAQQYLVAKGASPMAILSESTVYYIQCKKNTLKRKTWLRTLESTITIRSTFTEKKLVKKTPHNNNILTSDWKPGINLITFKMYHGIYPGLATVKKALSAIEYVWHNDWAMHNIIMQGNSLVLIDYGDPRMHGHEQSHSLVRKQIYQKIIRCLDLKSPKDVEVFYWKYLKTRPKARGINKVFKTIFCLSE